MLLSMLVLSAYMYENVYGKNVQKCRCIVCLLDVLSWVRVPVLILCIVGVLVLGLLISMGYMHCWCPF